MSETDPNQTSGQEPTALSITRTALDRALTSLNQKAFITREMTTFMSGQGECDLQELLDLKALLQADLQATQASLTLVCQLIANKQGGGPPPS